jgi:NADH dehydrogenase FAD-containing subunit
MKESFGLAALALAVALGQGLVVMPLATAAATAQASEVVAGTVTHIDHERSRVTVQSSDGTSYEFEASAETLKDLKVGDRIEAKRRPATD